MTAVDGAHVWVVQLGDGHAIDPQHRSVTADTLSGALKAAVASVRLPVVPRRPPLRTAWNVQRDGGRWRLMAGSVSVGLFDRKRDAVTAMLKAETRETVARDEWDDRWSRYVATHVEGVDFYWVNR